MTKMTRQIFNSIIAMYVGISSIEDNSNLNEVQVSIEQLSFSPLKAILHSNTMRLFRAPQSKQHHPLAVAAAVP
jgi:hypothetical protein